MRDTANDEVVELSENLDIAIPSVREIEVQPAHQSSVCPCTTAAIGTEDVSFSYSFDY